METFKDIFRAHVTLQKKDDLYHLCFWYNDTFEWATSCYFVLKSEINENKKIFLKRLKQKIKDSGITEALKEYDNIPYPPDSYGQKDLDIYFGGNRKVHDKVCNYIFEHFSKENLHWGKFNG